MSGESPSFDPGTVAADLFEAHRVAVLRRVVRSFPAADPDLVYDAFVDAMLQVADGTAQFDPARGTIADFLLGAWPPIPGSRRLGLRHPGAGRIIPVLPFWYTPPSGT